MDSKAEKAEHVIKQALELPSRVRAFLAEKLLESLDFGEPFEVSSEWRDEIERRCRQIDEDQAQLIVGDKVFKEAGLLAKS